MAPGLKDLGTLINIANLRDCYVKKKLNKRQKELGKKKHSINQF